MSPLLGQEPFKCIQVKVSYLWCEQLHSVQQDWHSIERRNSNVLLFLPPCALNPRIQHESPALFTTLLHLIVIFTILSSLPLIGVGVRLWRRRVMLCMDNLFLCDRAWSWSTKPGFAEKVDNHSCGTSIVLLMGKETWLWWTPLWLLLGFPGCICPPRF